MTEIFTYKASAEIAFASTLCLAHKLYVSGWSFRTWLSRKDLEFIRIVFVDNVPVGNFIKIAHDYYPNCGIYIKPAFRGQGLGKELMQTTYKDFPHTNFRNGRGVLGSNIFFEKCKM